MRMVLRPIEMDSSDHMNRRRGHQCHHRFADLPYLRLPSARTLVLRFRITSRVQSKYVKMIDGGGRLSEIAQPVQKSSNRGDPQSRTHFSVLVPKSSTRKHAATVALPTGFGVANASGE
jgi:hypothetical protein